MKNLFALVVIVALSLCTVQAQNWGKAKKATGPVVKKELQLDKIHGFELDVPVKMILTQGNTQKVVAEGQEDVIAQLSREVEDGIWEIDLEQNMNFSSLTIYLTIPSLTYAGIDGAGKVESTNQFGGLDALQVTIDGAGKIELDIQAQSIQSEIDGAGKIELKGSTRDLAIDIDGSGNVRCSELKAERCQINIDGSGNVKVQTSQTLEANIDGSGNVTYYGNPKVTKDIDGAGRVKQG